jgi:hypothetical protein
MNNVADFLDKFFDKTLPNSAPEDNSNSPEPVSSIQNSLDPIKSPSESSIREGSNAFLSTETS